MAWSDVKEYWNTALNTAYAANEIDEPDYLEAVPLLDRWIDTEEAKDKAAEASDIASYSIAGRSVQRQGVSDMTKAASDARQAFMNKLFGTATYFDFSSRQEVDSER